jgi:hypothetical protein
MRNWGWRPIVLMDLLKAAREAERPEIIRPQRWVTVNPSIEEVEEFGRWALANAKRLSVDTETWNGQIEMCGFAPDSTHAFVIPFLVRAAPFHYWPSADLEVRAFRVMRSLVASDIPKTFQNGLYDIQYFWSPKYGIPVKGFDADTMIRHHSLFPELPKGLAFLGSIYTDESSWKLLRHRADEMNRREE